MRSRITRDKVMDVMPQYSLATCIKIGYVKVDTLHDVHLYNRAALATVHAEIVGGIEDGEKLCRGLVLEVHGGGNFVRSWAAIHGKVRPLQGRREGIYAPLLPRVAPVANDVQPLQG